MKYDLFYQLKDYVQQHPEQFNGQAESNDRPASSSPAIQEHFTGSTDPVPVPALSIFYSR